MKITEIETIMLRLPKVLPNGDGLQDVLIVRVHTDAGLIGIGEAHTSPLVLKAIIDAPVSQLTGQGLRQLLIGRNPFRINELWHLMYDHTATFGRRGVVINAISGIDIALWDIVGKAVGKPVYQLLGGACRDSVVAYASDLMPAGVDEIIDQAKRHAANGFRAIKFGWGQTGKSVRRDSENVHAIRCELGSEIDIMLDVGVPLAFEDALWLARTLEEDEIYFLEEPLSPDDLEGFSKLVAQSPIPIATGEKETTRFGFRDLMERGGLRIIQPDIARCGGLTEMRRIAAMAETRNVRVIPHCWATDILVSATLQFLATQREASYLEFNVTENPLRKALPRNPIQPVDGLIPVPNEPGLGVELDEQAIERFRWSP